MRMRIATRHQLLASKSHPQSMFLHGSKNIDKTARRSFILIRILLCDEFIMMRSGSD